MSEGGRHRRRSPPLALAALPGCCWIAHCLKKCASSTTVGPGCSAGLHPAPESALVRVAAGVLTSSTSAGRLLKTRAAELLSSARPCRREATLCSISTMEAAIEGPETWCWLQGEGPMQARRQWLRIGSSHQTSHSAPSPARTDGFATSTHTHCPPLDRAISQP